MKTNGCLLGAIATIAVMSIVPRAESALIGYWSFDEGSGTTVDDQSSYGNDGTIFGEVSYVPGQVGTALAFDGSSTYVNVYNAAPGSVLSLINTSFTIAFWMNPATVTGSTQRIINKDDGLDFGGGYSVLMDSSLTLATSLNTGSNNNGTFAPALSISAWTYVTITYDLSTGLESVYQNATLVGTKAIVGTIQDQGSDPLLFGQIPVFNQWYNGSLDEIRMYDQALTQPEIAQLMAIPEASTVGMIASGGVLLLGLALRRPKCV